MATESIGKTIYMTNEMADRFIAAMEEVDRNPPPPPRKITNWGDTEKIAEMIRKEYADNALEK